MIKSKAEYKQYRQRDMEFYYKSSKKVRFWYWILRDPCFYIAKYIRLLRMEEYHANVSNSIWHRLMSIWALSRKNALGNKLGFKIPRNCIGPGLTIYHHGEVIVNEDARIGADCRFHGGNCIGNNGKTQAVPQIGDGLDLGIGAKIIGGVKLGNDVTVGANAVVTRSVEQDGVILVGLPARVK